VHVKEFKELCPVVIWMEKLDAEKRLQLGGLVNDVRIAREEAVATVLVGGVNV